MEIPARSKLTDEILHKINNNVDVTITKLVIGPEITIPSKAFKNNANLKVVVFTGECGEATIGSFAFENCSELSKVEDYYYQTVSTNCFKNCTKLCSFTSKEITSYMANCFSGDTSLSLGTVRGEKILSNAFKDLYGIDSLSLNSKKIDIKSNAFSGTKISKIYCKTTIETKIEYNTDSKLPFKDVSIGKIIVDDGVKVQIGLFAKSKVNEIEVVNGCIGGSAFWSCTDLKKVNFQNIIEMGSRAFSGCTNLGDTVNLSGYTGLVIDTDVFKGCQFKKIVLSDSIKTIGPSAFSGCSNLESIVYDPSSEGIFFTHIKAIENLAFENCAALSTHTKKLSLDSIETLYGSAFNGCRFSSIEISKDCILNLYGANDEDIFNIQETPLSDGNYVTLLKISGGYMLNSVRATKDSIVLDNNLNIIQISSHAFDNSVFKSVNLGSNLKKIDDSAFEGLTELQTVTWSSDSVEIKNSAFKDCTSLSHVGNDGTLSGTIGRDAFNGCTSLVSVSLSNVNLDTNVFKNCTHLFENNSLTLSSDIVLNGSGNFSGTAASKVIINSDVLPYTFAGCIQLNEVILGGCCNIGERAFENTSIASLNIPAETKIGQYAFYNCSKLIDIKLGSNVSVGKGAFSTCEELESISVFSGVVIGEESFQKCVSLTKKVGDTGMDLRGAKEIGKRAFEGCISIDSIIMSDVLTEISWDAFYGCSSIIHSEDQPWAVITGDNSIFKVEGNILYSADGKRIVMICPTAESIEIDAEVTEIECVELKESKNQESATSSSLNLRSTDADSKKKFSNQDSAISSSLNLRSINVHSNNTVFGSIDGVLTDKSGMILAVPYSISEDGMFELNGASGVSSYAFYCVPINNLTLKLTGSGVIEDYAFRGCPLDKLTIYADFLDYSLYSIPDSDNSLDTLDIHASKDTVLSGSGSNYVNVFIESEGDVYFTGSKNAVFYSVFNRDEQVIISSSLDSLSVVSKKIIWSEDVLGEHQLGSLSFVADDIELKNRKFLIGSCDSVNIIIPSLEFSDTLFPSSVKPNVSKDMASKWDNHYAGIIKYNETYGILQALSDTYVYYASDIPGLKLNDFKNGSFSISTPEGHAPADLNLNVVDSTVEISCSGDTYKISNYSSKTEYVILIAESDESDAWIKVSFDTGCDISVPSIQVSKGHTLLKSMLPVPERRGFTFDGWYTDPSLESIYTHDSNGQFESDTTLYAKWISEGNYLDVDASAGKFYVKGSDGKLSEYVPQKFTGAVTLVFEPYVGYMLVGYYLTNLDNDVVQADSSLSISSVDGYACIVPNVKYASSSTDLEYVVERDTPKQSDSLVLAWSFDGGKVVQSGMVWSGMPSVPLIVDDRVYIQANDQIFCVDAETGATIKVVETGASTTAFYHYLGYGGGYIVDYTSKKIFNEDLEKMCSIPDGVRYLIWHDGAFYGIVNSGSSTGTACKLVPDESKSDLVNQFENAPSVNVFQELYGTTSHAVIVGDVMYYISVDGKVISINALDMKSGNYNSRILSRLTGYYLDDGWLTAYNGYLYITAYVTGLFGTTETSGDPLIGYMKINGTEVSEPSYTEVDADGYNSLTSALVIQNGRGYLNVTKATTALAKFLVYNIDTSTGEPKLEKSINSASSHGSLVASTYNYDPVKKSGEVYIYLLNYSSNQFLYIFRDVCKDGTWTLSDTVVKRPIEPGFGSQAVRVGTEGQLIFYNDSGKVYCYGTPEFSSRFGFLVDNGDTADIRIGDGVETDAEKALEKAVADAFGVRKADVNLTDGTVVVAGKTYYMYYINSDGQVASIKTLKDGGLSKVKTFYLTDENDANNIDPDEFWYSSDAENDTLYKVKDVVPNLRAYQPAIVEKSSVIWGYDDVWIKELGDIGKLISISIETVEGGYKLAEGKVISNEGCILKGFTDGVNLYANGDKYQINGRSATLEAVWVRADMGITKLTVAIDGNEVEDRDSISLVTGEHKLSVDIQPKIENGYTILSSNTNILSVDASGKITAIKPGKVTLTITAMSGSEDKKISVEITVVDPTSTKIVDMVDSSVSLDVGATKDLSGVKTDLGKSVKWSSSNPSVAAVSNGKLVALAEGTAVMTATAEDNDSVTATFIVTVSKAVKPIQSVDLDKSVYTLKIKGTVTLKATVTPSDADDVGRLIWESSKPSVASVSSGGVVTAISAGSTVITVSTADGRYSDTCVITVEGTVTSVSLDQDTLRLEAGKSATLKATTAPDESTKFTWTSSDSKVASVSGGKVTAIAPGTATITVKCGDLTATCTVTVYKNSDVKTEVDTDKETGNTTTKTEETTTSGDSTVTTKTEETKDKDDKSLGTDIKVDAESGNGNVKTEATVKKDSDGNVTESTMTTTIAAEVKSSNGKQTISISQDDLLAAVDQIEAVRNATGQDLEPVITIDVSSKGSASASSATIPSDALEKMSRNGDAQLQLKTSAGTVEITSDVMSKLSENGEDVKLGIKKVTESEISQETKAKIGDAHMFELSATTGSTEHHQLGGKVIVSLPYVLDGGRSSKDVRVYHMDDSGNLVQMTCAYDVETGMVSFVTDHFSYFVVSDKALIDEPGAAVSSDDGLAGLLTIVIALLVVLIAMIAAAFVLYIRNNHAHI